MPRRASDCSNVEALIFVEGETDLELFRIAFPRYLKSFERTTFNMKGNVNACGKILDRTDAYLARNRSTKVRILCFVDRESVNGSPPLKRTHIIEALNAHPDIKAYVLSVDVFVATKMIESWFFHDIDGIYKFLRTPLTQRKPHKYSNVKKFGWMDLSKLFKECGGGKRYMKGKRVKHFVESLDIDRIYTECDELRTALEKINRYY